MPERKTLAPSCKSHFPCQLRSNCLQASSQWSDLIQFLSHCHCRSTSWVGWLFVRCKLYVGQDLSVSDNLTIWVSVSYWEIIVILLTDVWCLASPPARGDCEQHQVWWHNLRSPTLIWHNPSPSALTGNIIIHSDTAHCSLDWLTDWLIQFLVVVPARRVGCYTKLNQVILAGPLMGREILCSNQINQLENPLQMCGGQNVLYTTLPARQRIYLALVFSQKETSWS